MLIQDQIELSDFAKTDEGFMVLKNSRLARSGIQIYLAGSLGDHFSDRDPNDKIRIYRPPSEVFAADALSSLSAKPITIEHRGGFVNAENAKDLVVGHLGDTIGRDGDLVTGAVHVTHEDGIKAIEGGKIELSVGYDLDLEVRSGTTPEGEAYDAIQRNIRANHVALVSRGRGGPSCRVHDGANSKASDCNCQERSMTMKIVDCGGVQVEMSDAAAIALGSLTEKHGVAIQVRDEEIEGLKAKSKADDEKLAKLEAKADDSAKKLADAEALVTPEALNDAATRRVSLLEDAKKLAPDLDCSAMDSKTIKVEALKAIDVDTTDKSDDYIDAAFDARVENADSGAGTAVRTAEALAKASKSKTTDADDGPRAAYLKRQSAAYKGDN